MKETTYSEAFWKYVVHSIKIYTDPFKLLRTVDVDMKHFIGFVYGMF